MTGLHAAWQAALAAEHQAVFGYALVGVQLVGTERRLAMACSDAHRHTRDSQESAIAVAGLTPVGTEADYPALYPVADAVAARRLAVRLESACAIAWRYLYSEAATATGARATALRPVAQRQLTDSAVRGTRWRTTVDPARATVAFPGIEG